MCRARKMRGQDRKGKEGREKWRGGQERGSKNWAGLQWRDKSSSSVTTRLVHWSERERVKQGGVEREFHYCEIKFNFRCCTVISVINKTSMVTTCHVKKDFLTWEGLSYFYIFYVLGFLDVRSRNVSPLVNCHGNKQCLIKMSQFLAVIWFP